MAKIKLCGLSRKEDITAANTFKPEFIGFVLWKKSKRYVDKDTAIELKKQLNPDIQVVGVFVDEDIDLVVEYLNEGIIDIAQLHGKENEKYIHHLREQTQKPIIKAFLVKSSEDVEEVNVSSADYVLLDAGMGEGEKFDWELLKKVNRPFFLAGGLSPDNVKDAIKDIQPFAVDVSSGIESEGHKDASKMGNFVANVRFINTQLANM